MGNQAREVGQPGLFVRAAFHSRAAGEARVPCSWDLASPTFARCDFTPVSLHFLVGTVGIKRNHLVGQGGIRSGIIPLKCSARAWHVENAQRYDDQAGPGGSCGQRQVCKNERPHRLRKRGPPSCPCETSWAVSFPSQDVFKPRRDQDSGRNPAWMGTVPPRIPSELRMGGIQGW